MTEATLTPPFHMMAKPVSYQCNLKCDYCFYLSKQHHLPQPERMTSERLRDYIHHYIDSNPSENIDFAWQGGEPTLAGLDFYQTAVKYQQLYNQGKTITNSFQTNGIALNHQWARFFAEQQFLVGLSSDGIADVHDYYRRTTQGNNTFSRVAKSLALLQQYHVEFNTLTVINQRNWQLGKATYHALKSLGVKFMQFIPIVEDHAPHCAALQSDQITAFSSPAEGYGQFMCDIFDEWIQGDVGHIFVRLFDSLLMRSLGYPSPLCILSKQCGQAVVIEANGDIYSCDHFVYPEHRLGNLHDAPLSTLIHSPQQQRFGQAKYQQLTQQCQACPFLTYCYGGCPKHRCITQHNEPHKQNYFCPSYLRIFNYVQLAMSAFVYEIKRGGTASNVQQQLAQHYRQSRC